MKIRLQAALFCLVSALATTASAATIPKALVAPVQSLMTLLSDGNAEGYPKATMVQTIRGGGGGDVALVVFSLEGFGGGNNWQQYFAVFSTEDGKHYMLIDVMHIGGGAWRSINKLDAKTSSNLINVVNLGANHWDEADVKDEKTKLDLKNGASIQMNALENTGDDPPNFPSKKVIIKLILKNGRLSEEAE